MKKKLITTILAVCTTLTILTGCSQSGKVSVNLSKEADNFNVVRELTVINAIQGDVLFTMVGKLSVETTESKLYVIVEDENGDYQKHIIRLSDNITYVLEQKDFKDVENYKYTLNYNPKMWIPVNFENID